MSIAAQGVGSVCAIPVPSRTRNVVKTKYVRGDAGAFERIDE
jgi:hypothetical protein